MGKIFVLVAAIAVGYSLGYRDARAHPDHVVTRVVEQIKETFGTGGGNDVDAVMNRLEGRN
jgi:hypothetical protein